MTKLLSGNYLNSGFYEVMNDCSDKLNNTTFKLF